MAVLWLLPQLTVYLGKRDFVDQVERVESVGESLMGGRVVFGPGESEPLCFRRRRPDGPGIPEGEER